MLVIWRRAEEKIVFTGAGQVEITVMETRRDLVRLGIKAPPSIQVQRQEIIARPIVPKEPAK